MRLTTIPWQGLTPWWHAAEKTRLPADEVHIWGADLRVEGAVLCACWDLLSPEEMRTASGYRFARDRREFVVTRALLRQILAHYAGQATADLCFDSNASCKPALREAPSLHFSVSHSRGLALLAVAHNPVGIDVEFMQPGVLWRAVIEQCLSRAERSRLQALPAKMRAAALYRCWTQKEAVLKALGIGLLYPPRRLNVYANGRKPHVVRALGRTWLVRQVGAPTGYAAAAAIEQPDRRFRWRQWEFPLGEAHL